MSTESPKKRPRSSTSEPNQKQRKKRKKLKRYSDESSSDVIENKHSKKMRESLKYLHQWKNDRDNWKFQKLKQQWILDHLFNLEKVRCY